MKPNTRAKYIESEDLYIIFFKIHEGNFRELNALIGKKIKYCIKKYNLNIPVEFELTCFPYHSENIVNNLTTVRIEIKKQL